MSSGDKYIDNFGKHGENIEFDVAGAGEEVIVYVDGTGTENTNTKYLNKGEQGLGFVLRPSATVKIVSIGDRTFRDPITVSTAGWAQTTHIPPFSQITIRTTTTNTHIQLFVM